MNGIIGMTQLLLDLDLPAAHTDHLQIIKGSADALLDLINDILDFSKIEAGKFELSPTNFELRKSIEATANLLKLHAAQKGVLLEVNFAPDVPDKLFGDSQRLGQVVTNLIANAIKFTNAEGKVSLDVSVDGLKGFKKIQNAFHFTS